ncbi:hypothetical protein DLM75_13825 [Leptospira stimsonii]|uniref:Uncharacterized protein n=1 Tax=Leptospira stimsonii TaxID=2202203 RepID=A0A396Z3B6_9LEPT|nr:hypothetical protein DLM75_13825 [Leptospira stimsonii]
MEGSGGGKTPEIFPLPQFSYFASRNLVVGTPKDDPSQDVFRFHRSLNFWVGLPKIRSNRVQFERISSHSFDLTLKKSHARLHEKDCSGNI